MRRTLVRSLRRARAAAPWRQPPARSRLPRRSRQMARPRRREPHARARMAVDRLARRALARHVQDRLRARQPDRAAEGPRARRTLARSPSATTRRASRSPGPEDAGRHQGQRRRGLHRARPRDRRHRLEWVTLGRLSLQFVKREDGKIVVRAADRESPRRKSFAGSRLVRRRSADYKVPAKFIPVADGATIPDRQRARRDQLREGGGHARVHGERPEDVVRRARRRGRSVHHLPRRHEQRDDVSAGTLPGGREAEGRRGWVVDFNKAYNPPCAFSAYTTCPLPPPQNWLKGDVAAGEKYAGRKS